MADTTTTAAKAEAKAEPKAGAKDKPAKTEADTASGAGNGAETPASAADAPKGFSRGENQKVVTEAYRRNWDDIFGTKPRRKSKS